ncbi:alpha/beta hydrolase [Paraburkholderia sp. UYCP14C]|uniref:alpha/beta fold hydrolase n=1 Tax=Paraburkholderia sp. UYCP14C TaxID=2511130 RepID=UPI00101EAA6F|nr:alpha/beta hydrolase [Paraburkholderia sp. UYCP14C]RZF25804.1 alpha/beta hydrolase [Paraburkholderia sp. UYCP14C]
MRILPTLTLAAAALAAPMLASAATPQAPEGVKNIVIVHDAFTDGSGWRVVFDILSHKGYNVTVVQEPLTTLDEDVAATRSAIVSANGPVVLVGDGYGGSVITVAGTRPKVKALVYVAAYQPDVGESATQLAASVPEPTNDIHASRDGHLFFDSAKFSADYAGDLIANRTNFMAASQMPATAAAFGAQTPDAAWHDKPSYGIVATQDRVLSPDLQRWMYQRAGSRITEVGASHAIVISQPEAVAQVIEDAALHAN